MSTLIPVPIWRSILACMLALGLASATYAQDVEQSAEQTASDEQDAVMDQDEASPSVLIVERIPVHRPALEVVPDEVGDQQITCTWEPPVGSRVMRKRCVTEEHRRIVSRQWQEWLRLAQIAHTYN